MTCKTNTLLLRDDAQGLARAAEILRQGGLVALPTETVYGLGADATNAAAVARIYAAKGRPSFNPLIVHVPDLAAAEKLAQFDDIARRLAAAFWPGPLTLVVPLRPDAPIASLVTAGLDTLAIRVPAHPLAQKLLRAAGIPVAAPSANPSGRTSATRAQHVIAGLGGKVDAILDGGATGIGLESTIVGCTGGQAMLLRPGGLAREEIERVLGAPLAAPSGGTVTAPGQLASHYAPRAPVHLNAAHVAAGEALLAFGPGPVAGQQDAKLVLNLSSTGDLLEAAANLFDFLHRLDACEATAIAVAPIPRHGLGEAINDRLARAAAPRP